MGHHHDAAGVVGQVLFQPSQRVDVQMVGRLVQQQQVGAARELDTQRQPRFLSAAQLAHRHTAQFVVEAQPPQDTRTARPEFQSAVPQEAVMQCRIRFGEAVIRAGAACRLRACVQRRLHLLQFRLGGKQVGEGMVHMLQCALVAASVLAVLREGSLLREDAHGASFGEEHLSGGRFHAARQVDAVAQHPEQGGFPASVDSDYAYAVALLHREGYVFQHGIGAELQCQGCRGEDDHGGVFLSFFGGVRPRCRVAGRCSGAGGCLLPVLSAVPALG